jgi:hypothetical protein
MTAKLYRLTDWEWQPAGEIFLIDNHVVYKNVSEPLQMELQQFGILYGGKTYYPPDGEDFMKVLPLLSGSYFMIRLYRDNREITSEFFEDSPNQSKGNKHAG